MKLKDAIKEFQKAQQKLDEAEKLLNLSVSRSVRQRNTVGAIMELIEILPKKYAGTRRIYEKALRIENLAR